MNLDELFTIIQERKGFDTERSYTARLIAGGVDRIGKKIGEEAVEFVLAAKDGDRAHVAHEAADLFYHALVLLVLTKTSLTQIYAELDRRHTVTSPPTIDEASSDRHPE